MPFILCLLPQQLLGKVQGLLTVQLESHTWELVYLFHLNIYVTVE